MMFSASRKHILVHVRTETYECLNVPPKNYSFSEVLLVDHYSSGPMHFMVYLTDDVVIGADNETMFPLFADLNSSLDDDILARVNNVCLRYIKHHKATTFVFVVFNTSSSSILVYKDQTLPRVKSPEKIEKFFNGVGFYDIALTAAYTMMDIRTDEETIIYVGKVTSFSNVIIDSNYNWRNSQDKLTKKQDAYLLYTLNLNETFSACEFSLVITEPDGLVLVRDGVLPVANNILDELDNILQTAKPRYGMSCLSPEYWLIECAKKYTTTSSRYTWAQPSSVMSTEVINLLKERSGKVE